MNEPIFDQQLALSLQRLEELWQRVDELPPDPTRRTNQELLAPPQDLLKESLEGLSVSLQELQVAAESLRQEKEELALSLTAEAAERQRYQELFQLAPDGYLVTTKDGTITKANQTVGQLLNIAPDRLITKPLVVFVDPQERRDFYAKLSQLQKGESIKNWQIQLQRWRDAFFKVSCTVTPIQDSQNQVVGLRWQLQDLTPNQETETEQQHQALFRAMFENAATGIVILDSQGGVIKSNRALASMLGFTSQDLETVLPKWLNLDKSGIESVSFQQLIAGKRRYYQREKCYNAPDKSMRWGRLTYSLVQGVGNQPAFATCMLEDITELHQLKTTQQEAVKQELALKQQLALKPAPEQTNSIERLEPEPQQLAALVEQLGKMLNDILSSTPEFFFVYDATGKYIYVNRSAAQALGLTQSDFISKTWQQLKLPAEFMERLDAQRANVFNNGQPITDEASFATVEGIRDYEYTISPISDVGSNPEAVVVTVRDISEQKRASVAASEAMAKEEEFSALKSHFSYFASVITHELRNPLNNIFACTKLIENNTQPETDEKTLSYLHLIQVNARRMNQLLNDLLLMKKVEANELHLNPSLLNLTQFCQDLTEELQQGAAARHTITFTSQEQCSAVNLDKKLLRHILTNLLLNAIKYSPEGGEVKLDVSCQNKQVILRIQDSGSDIPQADQDLLFKMFNQNGKVGVVAGSGLGLLIVKQCIDLQGGEIAVESTPGVGTTLTVTLPLHSAH
jgi:PAS domain S-box-containing protein